MSSGYPYSHSFPIFDIDTLSPETLREVPSPAMESVRTFFPPLPESSYSLAVNPLEFIEQAPDAQHQMTDTFEHSPNHSLLTDPPGALEAMRMQQNSGGEVSSYPHMRVMHWSFSSVAQAGPPLRGESPDSFLRDAPSSIFNRFVPATFDPELPAVRNSFSDKEDEEDDENEDEDEDEDGDDRDDRDDREDGEDGEDGE